MALPQFTIDLGNGTYLDSSGALKTAVAEGRASFKLPAALPIPGPELQKVFKSYETIIPNLNKLGVLDSGEVAKFAGLGMSEDVVNLFGKVANVAEKLSSIVPVVNIVVGLANILGVFGGSDPMKDLVTQQINRLIARLDRDERNRQLEYVRSCTNVFDSAVALVEDYKNELDNPYAQDDEIARKLQGCEEKLSHYDETLFNAADGHRWAMPFDLNDYKWNRGLMMLYAMPDGSRPKFIGFPADAPPFDHRHMMPVLIYGVQSYLTLIKAIAPEHRTTGQFHAQLVNLADRLAKRLSEMRENH